MKYIRWFKNISIKDVPLVGGKNASLGEMYRHLTPKGINIPNGFAITAIGYWHFLRAGGIEKEIKKIYSKFNPHSIKSLQQTGKKLRKLILNTELPPDLQKEIIINYKKLSCYYKENNLDVAVRSSATAEDLPTASFAGQHETYLNIKGEKELLIAVKKCIASLFTDRAIMYREEQGIDHLKVALSVGIMKMVRSDLGSSGVMFTIDTESGFPNVIVIDSIWGIGEMIVKGKITPDEFYVFKPTLKQGFPAIIRKNLGRKTKQYIYNKKGGLKEVTVGPKKQNKFSLTDKEILILAKWGLLIEEHYSKLNKKWTPQDIEWAKDGKSKELFIVQSRPETVFAQQQRNYYEEYFIRTKAKPLLTGIAVGNKIGWGKVRVIKNIKQLSKFRKGEILVARMTNPDWTSVMPLAKGIITDEGGRVCHAAIVSRELGIPCIVGTKNATKVLKDGEEITIDCSSGSEGKIYKGKVPFVAKKYELKKIPHLKTKISINIGAPEIAFQTSFLPNDGVGLARMEFILAEKIKIHPLALYHYDKIKKIARSSRFPNRKVFQRIINKIDELTIEHKDKKEYFIKELAEGIAQIAAAFYPKEVIVRFSDFKTNEYRQLVGGFIWEPQEDNPMLGWRGASRYYDPRYRPAFEMECRAIKRAREKLGLTNISTMIPFCRTPEEGKKVMSILRRYFPDRKNMKVYVMAEIPSNVILADKFLDIFDGMSIGSNDLTQLMLGIDRDNPDLSRIGNENNEAVKEVIRRLIKICRKRKKYVGICGQAPSDYPNFARFLIQQGITAISLNPDTVIKTIIYLAKTTNKK